MTGWAAKYAKKVSPCSKTNVFLFPSVTPDNSSMSSTNANPSLWDANKLTPLLTTAANVYLTTNSSMILASLLHQNIASLWQKMDSVSSAKIGTIRWGMDVKEYRSGVGCMMGKVNVRLAFMSILG
jgi:hypothetical protein